MNDRSGDEEFDVYIIELQNRFGYLRKSMMDRLKEKEKETKKETRNNREYFPQENVNSWKESISLCYYQDIHGYLYYLFSRINFSWINNPNSFFFIS